MDLHLQYGAPSLSIVRHHIPMIGHSHIGSLTGGAAIGSTLCFSVFPKDTSTCTWSLEFDHPPSN